MRRTAGQPAGLRGNCAQVICCTNSPVLAAAWRGHYRATKRSQLSADQFRRDKSRNPAAQKGVSERPLTARIATSGPAVRPTWFLWQDGSFWVLTGPWSRLISRVRADPALAAVVDECHLATGLVRRYLHGDPVHSGAAWLRPADYGCERNCGFGTGKRGRPPFGRIMAVPILVLPTARIARFMITTVSGRDFRTETVTITS